MCNITIEYTRINTINRTIKINSKRNRTSHIDVISQIMSNRQSKRTSKSNRIIESVLNSSTTHNFEANMSE